MSGVSKLYISGRERKIVEALLKARQAITMSELASELEVSSRTIHRDLKNVEEIVSAFDITLDRKSGSGLEKIGRASCRERVEEIGAQVRIEKKKRIRKHAAT